MCFRLIINILSCYLDMSFFWELDIVVVIVRYVIYMYGKFFGFCWYINVFLGLLFLVVGLLSLLVVFYGWLLISVFGLYFKFYSL